MELKSDKADILYIYRKLVVSFSGIKSFNGWMIAKAEFKIEKATGIVNKTSVTGKVPVDIKFIKQRKNYSVISACTIYKNLEYTAVMYIVKPNSISNKSMAGADIAGTAPEAACTGFSYLFTLKYTPEDIKKFIECTGDSNPVHQTATPVVPGFLMFGDIIGKELYKYAGGSKTKFVISFRNPVFAGEPAEVYRADGNGKIIAIQEAGQNDIRRRLCYKWEADIITEV